MRARRPHSPNLPSLHPTFVALVVLGAPLSARAADAADPFAETPSKPPAVPDSNVAAPSKQAPASAPAGSDANFPTGLVERLPSSAYPEPVTRGLYGSSLWLDMQGHQWPYYPRIGVGISGYGWVDTMYKRTRIGDPGQCDRTEQPAGRGASRCASRRRSPTGTGSSRRRRRRSPTSISSSPQPRVVDTDDLWVRTGIWKKWDITVGSSRRSLSITWAWALTSTPTSAPAPTTGHRSRRRFRSPTWRATSTTGRRTRRTSPSTSTCAI